MKHVSLLVTMIDGGRVFKISTVLFSNTTSCGQRLNNKITIITSIAVALTQNFYITSANKRKSSRYFNAIDEISKVKV